MKKIKHFIEKPPVSYIFAACVSILFYMLLSNFGHIKGVADAAFKLISPVFTGIIIAYLFNPIVSFFENKVFKKMKSELSKHSTSVTMTIVSLALVLILLLVALIPSVAKSVSTLVSNWESYITKLHELIDKVAVIAKEREMEIDFDKINDFVNNWTDKLFSLVKDNSKIIIETLGNVGLSVSNFAVGVLFGFCFLFSKKSLMRFVTMVRAAVFGEERIKRHNELLSHCNEVFIKYMGSTLLDAAIIGVLTFIFALIMRLPYAPLIAVIAGITNIIPTFGPMIGTALGMFFLVLDNPWNAVFLFVFECILQSIDGMIIKPKLFKGSLGLPAAWTLILIVLGGKIAGMTGIILSIPFGAIFVILWRETVEPVLERRKNKINPEVAIETEKDPEECKKQK